MPEAPAAPPPAGVRIVESGPPKMPAPTTRTISVSEMSRSTQGAPPPKEAATAEPPKRGSAKDRMFGDLRKKAKDEAGNLIEQPSSAAPPAQPKAEPAVTPAAGEPPVSPAASPSTEPAQPAKTKDGKVNPWHLVDEYKKKVGELETQHAELTKRAIPEAKWKDMETQLADKQKRLDELEGEIRYVDYTKSDEYKNKYQKPYEAAWHRAGAELSEITVDDGNGGQRAATTQDMMELVNAKLGEARKIAEEKFGSFADDVMAHRKEIRKLYDEQNAALEQAKKEAGTREEQRNKEAAITKEKMTSELLTSWKSANDEVLADHKHGKYFTPIEGDAEGNQRLAKGFELADRAFSESPTDPKLTPEQRKEVIKRHAAVRLRAAAYGRLRAQNEAFEAQIAALTKELGQYRGSEPDLNGSRETAAPARTGKAFDSIRNALQKIAK